MLNSSKATHGLHKIDKCIYHIVNLILCFTDQLAISVVPSDLVIGKGTTAQFNAIASGISTTDESDFMYEWMKRSSDSLPDKVLGVNETVLIIPNVLESDEGEYYCVVTNEWGNSVKSNDVTLAIYGKHCIYYIYH